MTFSVTILGCGFSGGVPRPGLGWGHCDPSNPKNRRRRCSILVERMSADGNRTRVLVDTSPDLREQLLDAGVNVMTAVNIQHLETLNDAVNRSANTVIRETVPDSFLKRADEVVNVDVTVDELRTRLRAGKIYAPEKVEQSLANFFRKGNLNMLRELSLRRQPIADRETTRTDIGCKRIGDREIAWLVACR